MRQFKVFIPIVLFFSFPAQSSEKLFKGVKNLVYKVKTSLTVDSDKVSYGSSFPIRKDGLLITNFHVISSAFEKGKNYITVVEIGADKFIADIVNIDVTNDLALLKIDKKFDQVVSLSNRSLTKGETIYSLGFPKELGLSITEGLFNGLEKDVVYEQYHVSSPLNSGMSGGPTVDAKGIVIGVNVSYLSSSNNISFIVPIKFIAPLLEKEAAESLSQNKGLAKKVILEQVSKSQKRFTKDFLENNYSSKLGSFEIIKPSVNLKCWDQDLSKKEKKYKKLSSFCRVKSETLAGNEVYVGNYQVRYTYFESDKLILPAFYSLVKSTFSTDSAFAEEKIDEELYTQYQCDYDYIKNDSGISFKVSFCMCSYKELKGMRFISFRAVSLLKEKKAIVLSSFFSGFEKVNYTRFALNLLNGIKINNAKN